ncbi:MAG: hypothetical protein GY953_48605, partial [bacterium]|nr:hypothetical protein [bacterium]
MAFSAAARRDSAGDPPPPSPVVNGASFRPEDPLSPLCLASAFADLGDLSPAVAESLPLPDELAAVRVTAGGRVAKLLAVFPGQVNFQVPAGLPVGELEVTVERGGAVRLREMKTIAEMSPALFIVDRLRHNYPAAVLNEDSVLNDEPHRASRGSILQIFGTGFGPLDGEIGAGEAPTKTLQTRDTPRVFLGMDEADVLFSGPSPQFPGLWQINAGVPNGIE